MGKANFTEAFSAALIGVIEALPRDDAEKNDLCAPVAFPREPVHWIEMFAIGAANERSWRANGRVADWIGQSRLDPASRLMRAPDRNAPDAVRHLDRISFAAPQALEAAKRLLSADDAPTRE